MRKPTRPSQLFETRIKKMLARNEQAVNPKKKRHNARVIEKLCRLYRRGSILGVLQSLYDLSDKMAK